MHDRPKLFTAVPSVRLLLFNVFEDVFRHRFSPPFPALRFYKNGRLAIPHPSQAKTPKPRGKAGRRKGDSRKKTPGYPIGRPNTYSFLPAVCMFSSDPLDPCKVAMNLRGPFVVCVVSVCVCVSVFPALTTRFLSTWLVSVFSLLCSVPRPGRRAVRCGVATGRQH